MNRRAFISSSGAGAAGLLVGGRLAQPLAAEPKPSPGKRALMKVGATLRELDDDGVKAVVRYGIKNLVASPTVADPTRLYATVDELSKMRETAERNGTTVSVGDFTRLAK